MAGFEPAPSTPAAPAPATTPAAAGPRRTLHEGNRLSWNAATKAHNSHKGDQAAFLRGGGSTLFPEERELLGDVRGLRVAHLQCNSGQDSLGIAALGADVTGVDISDEAVAFAQRLSAESGIPSRFVRSDVYDWLAEPANAGRFDIAFSSYGALVWLSDLRTWAEGVAHVLAPGGRFVLVEFHPLAWTLTEDWRLQYDYFRAEPWEAEDGVSDYVVLAGGGLAPWGFEAGVQEFHNPHPAFEFNWSIAATVSALLEAGLRLEHLQEYPFLNGARMFEGMRDAAGRRFYPPAELPSLPLMYSLVARRA